MDYKVVTILAITFASALSLPYRPPAAVASVASDAQKAPPCPCSKVYFPLCASDGNTYNNACEFKCQAMYIRKIFGTELFVVRESKCEESV